MHGLCPLGALVNIFTTCHYQLTIKEKERKRNNRSDEIEYFVFMQSVIVSLTL